MFIIRIMTNHFLCCPPIIKNFELLLMNFFWSVYNLNPCFIPLKYKLEGRLLLGHLMYLLYSLMEIITWSPSKNPYSVIFNFRLIHLHIKSTENKHMRSYMFYYQFPSDQNSKVAILQVRYSCIQRLWFEFIRKLYKVYFIFIVVRTCFMPACFVIKIYTLKQRLEDFILSPHRV